MSHNQGNTRDILIDQVNDSDEDLPSPSAQEHIELPDTQDNTLLGAFNGDPLETNGSLQFKKSYNGSNPLEESVNPTLEDESLRLEQDSLNSFTIDIEPIPHHNSSLPSRSSESHNFNVSVSDSLPPNVMECDSPERDSIGEHDVEDDKDILPSQSDLFGTPHVNIKESSELAITYELNESLKARETTPERLLPTAVKESKQFSPFNPRSTSGTFQSILPLHSISPKRKFSENTQEQHLNSKALKLESSCCTPNVKNSTIACDNRSKLAEFSDSDNEVEIIDHSNPKDESIEVLYEKKESKHEETQEGSQDIRLVFTGSSQTQTESFSFDTRSKGLQETENDKSKQVLQDDIEDSSQSQSLLSMPDSENLLCVDSLSESPPPVSNTLPASQIEARCPPAAFHPSQPDIEPLLAYPIVGKSQQSSKNSCSNSSTKLSDHDPEGSHSDASQPSQETALQFINEPPVQKSPACMPSLDTPLEDSTIEPSESVFEKAAEAANKRLEEEHSHVKGKPPESNMFLEKKDSFEQESIVSDFNSSSGESVPEKSTYLTPLSSFSLNLSSAQPTPAQSNISSPSPLFPPKNDRESSFKDSQKQNIYVEDSDEESSPKDLPKAGLDAFPLSERLKKKLASSTPNLDMSIPDASSRGSSIRNDDSKQGITSELSNLEHSQQEYSDTEKILEVTSYTKTSELLSANFIYTKKKLPELLEWRNTSGEVYYSLDGDDHTVYKEKMVLDFTNPHIHSLLTRSSSSGSSGRGRISDVSSISRVTSSSGYLGDKSSSSEGYSIEISRFESTRRSMASVVTDVSGSSPTSSSTTGDNDIQVTYSKVPLISTFRKPLTIESHVETSKNIVAEKIIPENQPVSVSCQAGTGDISELVTPVRAKRGRGKGRGRPRGGGRNRRGLPRVGSTLFEESPEYEKVTPNTTSEKIENTEAFRSSPVKKDTILTVPSNQGLVLSASQEEKTDDYLSKLPPEMLERLKSCHFPLSEEDEEIFTLQNRSSTSVEDERLKAIILKKIREVDLKPGLLVFARYLDNSFYSAVIVKESSARDRWDVIYNIDQRSQTVLEVNILPTNFLPRGCFCYVRHHTGDICDPGTVKGHLIEKGILVHLVETHRGTVVKVPHSHLQLKASIAEEMLSTRRSFKCLVASPGRDISLDNVIPKERPRKAAMAKVQTIDTLSLASRKADANLDSSSGTELYVKPKGSRSKTIRKVIPENTPSTSETDSSPPKSAKKRAPSTPKAMKSIDPLTSLASPAKTKTPARLETPKKSKVQKKLVPSDSLSLQHNLKNPVVELIQLEEVATSPKVTPKKRGRKQSSTKTPRKALKLSSEAEEPITTVDPKFGPLPAEGCKIFQGYFVLITALTASTAKKEDLEIASPLDKHHLIDQISRGGGTVLDSFDRIFEILADRSSIKKGTSSSGRSETLKDQSRDQKIRDASSLPASNSPIQVICVSNTFCRTEKFIRCLVLGIPIVNSFWVINSCRDNDCKNWIDYLVPAGPSLLTGEHMEQIVSDSHRSLSSCLGQTVEFLKGEKIFLASSDNPKFVNLWLTLLTAAQAQVFTKTNSSSLFRLIDRRTSLVVADSSIPDPEYARAVAMQVPVVSTEWFIQSLLARCKLPYDSHTRFQHTYDRKSQINEES